MLIFDLIAEQRIAEALARGELANLPGEGKPLDLDDDRLVPENLRMARRILRNAGFVPPEVEAVREIGELIRPDTLSEGAAAAWLSDAVCACARSARADTSVSRGESITAGPRPLQMKGHLPGSGLDLLGDRFYLVPERMTARRRGAFAGRFKAGMLIRSRATVILPRRGVNACLWIHDRHRAITCGGRGFARSADYLWDPRLFQHRPTARVMAGWENQPKGRVFVCFPVTGVMPAHGGEGLLGQNFLRYFDVSQANGTLRLRMRRETSRRGLSAMRTNEVYLEELPAILR